MNVHSYQLLIYIYDYSYLRMQIVPWLPSGISLKTIMGMFPSSPSFKNDLVKFIYFSTENLGWPDFSINSSTSVVYEYSICSPSKWPFMVYTWGVILATSKSWNDPPSKIIKPQTTLIYKVSQ